ncbi:acyl-CoA synthetase [Cupriavidus sp. TKC]|nr:MULTISPECIES: AMP-binding protein [unclassified Cupriavidus]GMG94208.1 acyl-CoA synthetase [Cupriavidus sp. TKC]
MSTNFTSDQWVALHASRQADKVALQDERVSLSYARLNELVGQRASLLAEAGVRSGDAVGLLGSPTLEWAVAYLAISRAGGVPVGLNYRETPQCISDQMRSAGAAFVFHDAARREHIQVPDAVCMQLEAVLQVPPGTREAKTRPVDGADIGVILYTGGTTGSSKGVELTHENLLWNVLNEISAGELTPADRVVIATALHHSAALNTWLLPHLYLGATAILMGDFDPRRWIDMMVRFKATNSFTPPTMIRQILDAARPGDDWSSFTKWFSGAGILSHSDREEMTALCPGLRIYYQYGLTEAGPIVTCQGPDEYALNPRSLGRVVRHFEAKVLNDKGEKAALGEVGELVVRGPSVMRGYFRKPEATGKVLRDGWLHTGDLVMEDEHGCLTFHDRAKDMIKTGGLNVFSQEVEAALAGHPAVSEVAVIGLPDARWGERVVAVVSLKAGSSATEQDIADHGRQRLAGYQVPKQVIFMPVSEVPKNYLGKTLKQDLKALLRDSAAA